MPATPEQILYCYYEGEIPDFNDVEWYVVVAPAPPEHTPEPWKPIGYWSPWYPGAVIPVHSQSDRSALDGTELRDNWLTVERAADFDAAVVRSAGVREQWNYRTAGNPPSPEATEPRPPSEYMRPGLTPWTTTEFAHAEENTRG